MLKILEEIANRRIKLGSKEFQIQLSSFLMSKAVEEVNKIRESDKQLKQDFQMNEFKHSMLGQEWQIRNRAYRDDTNDNDVEEVIYEFACNK